MSKQSADQELLDYLNGLLVEYNDSITQEQNLQANIAQSITQQNMIIQQLNDQNTRSQQNVVTYQQDIVFVNELIVLVNNNT